VAIVKRRLEKAIAYMQKHGGEFCNSRGTVLMLNVMLEEIESGKKSEEPKS
jgi:hypothetical protein